MPAEHYEWEYWRDPCLYLCGLCCVDASLAQLHFVIAAVIHCKLDHTTTIDLITATSIANSRS
jgi:hypothetical protein